MNGGLITLLAIGAGGFFGAISRYAMSVWVHRALDKPWFPYGTMTVNLLGCFLLGLLAELADHSLLGNRARAFLMTGFLGAFTTFSTFGLETFDLLAERQFLAMTANILVQVVVGLLAVWLGLMAARAALP